MGVVATRNRAIRLAKGELIAPLDADDIWLPDNLERQVECMLQSDSSVGVVYSWSFDIDEQNKPMGSFHAFTIEGDVFVTLLCHFFLCNASFSLIRKTCQITSQPTRDDSDEVINNNSIPHERQWTVRVQTLTGSLLHWLVSSWFGDRQTWKNVSRIESETYHQLEGRIKEERLQKR